MSDIGIENILSLILVEENIRPAFLLQSTPLLKNDPSILGKIKQMFPNLIHSDDYTTYQGTIISKKGYNGRHDITTDEMGKILGYPCYKGFSTLDRNKLYYVIDVLATTVNGNKYCILTNLCQGKMKMDKFTKFAEKAKRAFKKEKYQQLIGDDIIENVEASIVKEIPIQDIIDKLIRNKELSLKEKDKILNILFNLGFSVELQLYFMEEFQYNNPVHKGILLTLLLQNINDNLTPFAPLQNYPEQAAKVEEIINQFEKDLFIILKRTSFNSLPKNRATVKKNV